MCFFASCCFLYYAKATSPTEHLWACVQSFILNWLLGKYASEKAISNIYTGRAFYREQSDWFRLLT